MKNKNSMLKKLTAWPMVTMILALCAWAAQTLFGEGSGYVACANTYDAAVLTHECSVTRTNDAAVTARHLLWKEGSTAGTGIALGTATAMPLGFVDNTETDTGKEQTVLLLGRGPTKKAVAAVAISINDKVYTAASGKVTNVPVVGCFYIGTANTAAAADGNIIELRDCSPQLIKDYSQIITMGSTTKAGGTLAVPVTHRAVVMTTGGVEALTLANGVAGQRLLLTLGTDGGDGTLTPTTKTGFATIVFADAKDFAELEYVDDTVGWLLVGYGGTAAPPVIS